MAEKRVQSTRVSLACIQCRAKHIRCDATKPACSRCLRERQVCNYPNSRRGGLTRALLAAHKARSKEIEGSSSSLPGRMVYSNSQAHPTISAASSSPSNTSSAIEAAPLPLELHPPFSVIDIASTDLHNDMFIAVFYKCFHRYHPCVLPLKRLQEFFGNPSFRDQLFPVITAARFIGSIYARSNFTDQLKAQTESAIAMARQNLSPSPFLAQALLLYSISLFWSQEDSNSRKQMDLALQTAFDLGMHRRGFAVSFAPDDPILQECFRRTWWQIYIVDAAYAAIERLPTFTANSVISDVDLPCEEDEYESSTIPEPSLLAEFDFREFESEGKVYSSFAYLVGVVRGLSQTSMSVPWQGDGNPSSEGVAAIDSVIDGWLLLLPESKQQVMNSSGEIDELLYFANMWVHAALISCHRALSDIIFNPLEVLSSCAGSPQINAFPSEIKQVHTKRCISSIQQQVNLLTLPKRPFCHSPFIICMVVVGTLPYFSACTCLLRGSELIVAREQIRVIIGCLKALGDVWKKGRNRVQELQAIGKEIIGATEVRSVRMSETAAANEAQNKSNQTPTLLSFDDSGILSSNIDANEFAQLWPWMNQQLDINTWITDEFPAQ